MPPINVSPVIELLHGFRNLPCLKRVIRMLGLYLGRKRLSFSCLVSNILPPPPPHIRTLNPSLFCLPFEKWTRSRAQQRSRQTFLRHILALYGTQCIPKSRRHPKMVLIPVFPSEIGDGRSGSGSARGPRATHVRPIFRFMQKWDPMAHLLVEFGWFGTV